MGRLESFQQFLTSQSVHVPEIGFALNLVLAAGDRLSRVVEREDSEYYPVRSGLLESEGGGAKREAGD